MSVSGACPCGSNNPLIQCCLPYHLGQVVPPSAEALMRSRYTAYVLGDVAYLKTTWHPQTLPHQFQIQDQIHTQWLGLNITRHEDSDDRHALVEFVARYKIKGRAYRLHEVSRFVREEGYWYYLDGTNI